jgi:hypothetical protein
MPLKQQKSYLFYTSGSADFAGFSTIYPQFCSPLFFGACLYEKRMLSKHPFSRVKLSYYSGTTSLKPLP